MLSGVPVERITPSCAQQGFTPMWILPGENVTAEVLKTPELGDVLAPQMAFPFFVEDAATEDYRTAMETDYRGPEEEMFSPLTSSAWMAGLVYEEVGKSLAEDGTVTSADIFNGLYQVKDLSRRRPARRPLLRQGRQGADRRLLLGDHRGGRQVDRPQRAGAHLPLTRGQVGSGGTAGPDLTPFVAPGEGTGACRR